MPPDVPRARGRSPGHGEGAGLTTRPRVCPGVGEYPPVARVNISRRTTRCDGTCPVARDSPGQRKVEDDHTTTLDCPGPDGAGAVPQRVRPGAAGPGVAAGAPGGLAPGAGGGAGAFLAAVG